MLLNYIEIQIRGDGSSYLQTIKDPEQYSFFVFSPATSCISVVLLSRSQCMAIHADTAVDALLFFVLFVFFLPETVV